MIDLKQQLVSMQTSTLIMNSHIVMIRRAAMAENWHEVASKLGELRGMASALAEFTQSALLNIPNYPPKSH